jgi:hypothetical protein
MAKAEDYPRYASDCFRLAQHFRGQAEAAEARDAPLGYAGRQLTIWCFKRCWPDETAN